MDDRLLHEALRHVDQAALALSKEVREQELAVARAQLDAVRALLTRAALQRAVPARAPSVATPWESEDDGPALVQRIDLQGDLRAAAVARSFCRVTCQSWGVPQAGTSTVVDLTSELVANATRHAGGAIDLSLERGGRHVLVTVTDESDDPPRLLPYRRGVSEQGIGLRLVDQLSESWGWHAVPNGKQVWARAAIAETSTDGRPARRGPTQRRPSADAH